MDPAAAKEFLISRVVKEAAREQISLSEIERKMLYFTESQPSLAVLHEVNATFEREYDSDEYERKVAGLLQRAREHDVAQSPAAGQQWNDAIESLKSEDHYILVMLYCAFPGDRQLLLPTHRVRDFVLYVAISFALVALLVVVAELRK